MSGKDRADALAESLANAMRDAFRTYVREHYSAADPVEVWANDVQRVELAAQYTPQGRGLVVVEVINKRKHRNDLYPYQLTSHPQGRLALQRKGEV